MVAGQRIFLARIMRHMERFLRVCPTIARRRSVRLDRREATRRAMRLGLICLCRRLVGAHGPAAHGPDGIRPSVEN